MPKYQEVRIRMEDKHVGTFARFIKENKELIPYASVTGLDVIDQVIVSDDKPPLKQLPPPKSNQRTYSEAGTRYIKRKKMERWQHVFDAVKSGHKHKDVIAKVAGYSMVSTAQRVLNTLKREGYIKGNEGTYTTIKELNYGN